MQVNQGKLLKFRGMNETDAWEKDPEWADYVENMERSPNGYWRTVPGALAIAGASWEGVNAIIGLVWFEPRANQRFLVYEMVVNDDTSKLAWVRWPDGVEVDICTRQRVPGRPASSNFLQVGRWLYHFNGIEAPVRWDGKRVEVVGFPGVTPSPVVASNGQGFQFVDACAADLTAPPALDFVVPEQRGVGSLPELNADPVPFSYAYGITWLNSLGQESPMSPVSLAIGTNTNQGTGNTTGVSMAVSGGEAFGKAAVYVEVPILPKEACGWRLWRSVDLSGASVELPELYLVDQFHGGGGCMYTDTTPDSELGELYLHDLYGSIPIGIRCAAFHHDSMWVAVDNFVYRSRPGFPEMFPPGNRYPVGSSGSGHIFGMWSVPRGLVIVGSKGIFMAKGNPMDGYRVETVSERVEPVGPRAMAYVDGMGLFVVTTTGPVVVQGTLDDDATTKVVPLSGIRKTWDRTVNPRGMFNSLVFHRPEAEEVWFHVPAIGESRPSFGFVYHYGGGGAGWSVRPTWKFSSACLYQGRVWLGSWDTTSDNTWGLFLLCRSGTRIEITTANNTPPDPSTPLSASYEEPFPERAGGVTLTYRDISYNAVVGTYESGVVRSPIRLSPASIDLLMLLTGAPVGMDVQVRYDRRVHWERTSDREWRAIIHSEQSDVDGDTLQRARWGEAEWSTSRMWTTTEPGFVRVPVPTDAQFEFQVRVRGPDMRLGGMMLEQDPSAPNRRREP